MYVFRIDSYLLQDLSWVEREGLLGQPDLLVSMTQLDLSVGVKDRLTFLVP